MRDCDSKVILRDIATPVSVISGFYRLAMMSRLSCKEKTDFQNHLLLALEDIEKTLSSLCRNSVS